MKFRLQNYNEFKDGIGWHDYFSFIINEFAILLVRKYELGLHSGKYTKFYHVQILGFKII